MNDVIAALRQMQGVNVDSDVSGAVSELVKTAAKIDAMVASKQIDATTAQLMKNQASAAALAQLEARSREARATATLETDNRIRLKQADAAIKQQQEQDALQLAQAEYARRKQSAERLFAEASRIAKVDPHNAAIKEAVTTLQSEYKDVNGHTLAALVQEDANEAINSRIRAVYEVADKKAKEAGVELPTSVYESLRENAGKPGAEPEIRIIDRAVADAVKAKSIGQADSAAVEKLIGQFGIDPAEAVKIVEEAKLAPESVREGVSTAKAAKVKSARTRGTALKGAAGVAGGLAAAYMLTKMFGEKEPQQLPMAQQLQLMQAAQQSGDPGASRTLMDVQRLLKVIGTLQSMAGTQTAAPAVPALL